ncbi:unnamed protein product [Gemmata massiliana]|uniref:PEP-CTERM protein-sorting domain-containing protein n=1 Tax=Gemmata massiliana TaxID=1210884 RepID=A0A6P2D6N0_9BACT|nr:hypothetical protein [Gemmata massiliana]VTR96971.1 unnamed protein product [Gemmata massiliana]
MTHFRNVLRVLAAVLVGTAVFGAPTQARAGFVIQYSLDGGAFTTVNSGDTIDGLKITASSYGDPTVSLLDLHVTGVFTPGVVETHTIVIQATVTDLTTAPAPQTLTTKFTAGTTTANAAYTGQSWVDNGNAEFGIPGTFTTGALTPGDGITPNFVGNFTGIPKYSLTTEIRIDTTGTRDVNIGADIDNVITPTPAPAGLVLMLSGLPLLGIARLRRRNLAAPVA